MKLAKLGGWMIVTAMVSNLFLYSASAVLAQAEAAHSSGQTVLVKSVNINTATREEFEAVRGIGPALADRIVVYRDANGKFKSLDQMKEVKGIGDAKFEKIKSQLTM